MAREEHKIIIEREIWERLKQICEVEGIPLSYKLEQLIMDKYAWNIQTQEQQVRRDNKRIKELLEEAIKLNNIPTTELKDFIVLYCNRCIRLSIVHKYSIAQWICEYCEAKLDKLGTLNNMVGR